jgi:Glycosyl hydrolases family 43
MPVSAGSGPVRREGEVGEVNGQIGRRDNGHLAVRERRRRRALLLVALAGGLGGFLLPPPVGAADAPSHATPAVAVTPATTPAFSSNCPTGSPAYNYPGSGDAADPDVVYSNGAYYAFTTGNALGNNIAALVSSSPNSGYGPWTGACYGSTALPSPSGWEQPNTQTSPGVFSYGGQWIMFYDAAQAGHATDSGYDCLAVATAPSISPGSIQFTDTSGAPLLCQPTGSIDPAPFVDPATGIAYLIWKQNDGGSSAPAYLWSQPLSPSGTSFALGSQPTLLMSNDTVAYPWEATVEDPSMAYAGGTYQLLFSAGVYTSTSYSEGVTTCAGPTGPCGAQSQILTSYGSALGPGGGSLFADAAGNWWMDYSGWQGGAPGCTSYTCGSARRLFVAPISLPNANPTVPCTPPAGAPAGYRFVASDGGVFDFGNLPFCGSMGGQALNKPIVGMAATPDGGGYWEVASDGGLFAFGNSQFYGSMGGKPLNEPIVGMAPTPIGGGYWEVASDGGLFAFGNAQFYGSMGGKPLNQPIVGMAATPTGGGYWEVASDGGLFAFGNAQFYGSMGGKPLDRPIVGIAQTSDGHGYWEVASDGGLFAFGDAQFFGSMGGQPLNQPVVAMAATPDARGYWEVASDGGMFSFGDAQFYGSMGGRPLNKPIVGMSAP